MNKLNFDINRLFFYSPFRFIKGIEKEDLTINTIINPIKKEIEEKQIEVIEIDVESFKCFFLQKKLNWDSDNLGFPCYKVFHILFENANYRLLNKAVSVYKNSVLNNNKGYYFFDIPSEDIILTQVLTSNGFSLVESRLNYYFENLNEYNNPNRYPVRFASKLDSEALRDVAIRMRNPFDRFHADFNISNALADEYIGKFAYNSAMGFADYIIVPDINKEYPIGFLAFNNPINYNGIKISKLVLAAIDNSIHKGWLVRLLAETIYKLKELDVDYLTTITQTSNIAAFRTWEKFGFKLAFTTNILVYKND